MAKLDIYRGDTLDREVELGERNVRIGRGEQNDIVLPDPAKSVSRFHAELRFENGRYSVVDLNSQNGTWVAGRRVQQAVLEPGVPVVLGTYRVVLKVETPPPSPEPAADVGEATMIRPVSSAVTPPESIATPTVAAPSKPAPPPVQAPAPPPAPAVVPPPVAAKAPPPPKPPAVEAPKAEAVAPPPPKPEPASRTEPPPAPKVEVAVPKPTPPPLPAAAPPPAAPVPKAAAPAPKPPVAARATAKKRSWAKVILVGASVVLVLAVLAGAGLYFAWPQVKPLLQKVPLLAQIAASGQPKAAAPTSPGAGEGPATSPAAEPPATPPAAEPPAAAPPALPPAQPSAGSTTVPARPAEGAAVPARKVAVVPRTGASAKKSTEADVKAKKVDVPSLYAQAKTSMIKGDYLPAIAALEQVVKADPKYLDASQMLDTARAGVRNQAQLAVDTGNRAADAKDYLGAVKQFERALTLDSSLTSATDSLKRVRAAMAVEGEDAFKRAKQYDALGRASDAVPMYEKAVQYLPPDSPNAKIAKDRLAALKGGGGEPLC